MHLKFYKFVPPWGNRVHPLDEHVFEAIPLLRSNLTAAFQNKVCSNNVFDRNDSLVTDFSGYSIAEMVCILLWIQSKKIKLRHTERGRSTYFPTWSQEPIEANLQAERARDPCPLLITLANGSRYSHISHYNGHQPQPGNCRLRKFHPRNEVTFCYWRPNQVNQRMTLVEFNSEWYRLHLAMEIVRRKGATMQVTDPFIDLPVAVGIVMATQLIRKDYDNITINESVLHEFVYNTGPATYHIFSSDRVIKFNILTQRYIAANNIPVGDLTALLQRLDLDCTAVLGISMDGLYGCDFCALNI